MKVKHVKKREVQVLEKWEMLLKIKLSIMECSEAWGFLKLAFLAD